MFSETFLARDVFAIAWDLGILGALSYNSVIVFPFDAQLSNFIMQKQFEWQQLMEEIRVCCCFTDGVMLLAVEDAPWRDLSASTAIYDRERLIGELLLAGKSATWSDIDFSAAYFRDQFLKVQAEGLLCDMVDAILQSRYGLNCKSGTVAESVSKVMEIALRFSGTWYHSISSVLELWSCKVAIDLASDIMTDQYRKWMVDTVLPELSSN